VFGDWFSGIDSVTAPGGGRIGLVACPGLRTRPATAGSLERRLGRDLTALSRWQAQALVTLLRTSEMEMLGVADLGDRVQQRGLQWHHLPILDGSAPGPDFEAAWRDVGPTLHGMLDRGQRIVVHCRAGLGRSGCIAARLLIERGRDNREAISAVRAARPFAIETGEQWSWVQQLAPDIR